MGDARQLSPGAEFSPYWNGYMDGAVRSGRHTATELLLHQN